MDINEKLDLILMALKERYPARYSRAGVFFELTTTHHLQIKGDELDYMLSYLLDVKYLMNCESRQHDGPIYTITPAGLIFLEQGGFSEQKRQRELSVEQMRVAKRSAIVAEGVAIASIIVAAISAVAMVVMAWAAICKP